MKYVSSILFSSKITKNSYDAEEKKYYCGHPMVEDAANWASLRISRHVINALLTLQTAS